MLFTRYVELSEFERFERELATKLSYLEAQTKKPASESAETAQAAATEANENSEKIRSHEAEMHRLVEDLREYSKAVGQDLSELREQVQRNQQDNANLKQEVENTRQLYSHILSERSRVDEATQEVADNIAKINGYLKQSEALPQDVEKAQALLSETRLMDEKISALLTHSLKRKGEIDELYKLIYGSDIKDEAGNVEHIDGIKDELERTYAQVSEAVRDLEEDLNVVATEVRNKHENLLGGQRDVFQRLIRDSNDRFNSVSDQLTGLLPGAMAAGLSAAYEQKKEDEITSLKGFDKNFRWAIAGMAAISAIPFVVNIYMLLWKNREIVDLIKDIPSIVLAILPLYFPVLWLAYSSNKRANLSKRLIEEYTHKAVLGKTFSGLSHQIETLEHQGQVKEELRTRLLFNVLQVSAENPGKLITNYSKSDHPLMDALENSAKLADSISTLAKIPGFSSLAKKLSDKADDLLKTQQKKVEVGLDVQEAIDTSKEEKKEPETTQ